MKNFNMTRFGRVLKLDFVEGRKAMMWGALCMLLLYLFFFWFAHTIGVHSSRYDFVNDSAQALQLRMNAICEGVAVFSAIALFIFFLITASTLYRGEQKKQQRIAWLMLPATNLEKFMSRWIYMLAFSIVGGVLPFFVADGIHMGYLWMAGNPVVDATSYILKVLPRVSLPYSPLAKVVDIYLVWVTIHSLYLLGGVLFKKFHFIATTAVFAVAMACFASVYNSLGYRDTPTPPDYIMDNVISIGFSVCLIALFTWLAYWLFCRWQVVTHKFANV
jgi:hypothetical protein